MARKNALTEEQKALGEELLKQKREQLASDAAATKTTWENTDFGVEAAMAKPRETEAAVVYADKPSNEPTVLDEAVVYADRNPKPETPTEPTMLGEAVVYADKDQKAKAGDATATPVSATAAAAAAAPKAGDAVREAIGKGYDLEQKSFADYLQSIKDQYDAERQEADDRIEADRRNARWAGATELAAGLANLIAVGDHNAVSQVYKSRTQDWMEKADAELKERRSRLSDLRKRQDEVRAQMNKVRADRDLALAKYDIDKRQQDITNAMAMRKAELEAQFKNREITINEYKAETDRIEALAKQAIDKAKLSNETRRVTSQVELNNARRDQVLDKMNGGNGTGSGKGSSSKPAAPTPADDKRDDNDPPAPPSRKR